MRRYAFSRHLASLSLSGRRPCWRRKRIPALVIAHLGNGALSAPCATGRVDTNGDDAAGRAHDGHPLWRCRLGAMAWIACETNQTLSDLERVVNKESAVGISGLFRSAGAGEGPARWS